MLQNATLCGNVLMTLTEKEFKNIVDTEENTGNKLFFPFPKMISTTPSKTNPIILASFISSSASPFNMDRSTFLLFG